ncbi:MAG: PIG-L domain-containing protein, partial [Parcubacteria group bacterium]|nr:PIG-L domain-containing protein [Parcubacteria group bacterium]
RIKLLCFETLSETEWNNKMFQPNIWVDIKGYMNTKIKAFKIYSTEVKAYPHPRSEEGIRVLSKKRGSEACFEYAESFMLVRDYII